MLKPIYQKVITLLNELDEKAYQPLLKDILPKAFSYNSKRVSKALLDDSFSTFIYSDLKKWGLNFRRGNKELTLIAFGKKIYLYRSLASLLKMSIFELIYTDFKDFKLVIKMNRCPINITPTWNKYL